MIRLRQYIALLAIAGFITLGIGGGGYVWTSFERVQDGLPVNTLKWHRSLTGMIQSLSNLIEKLGQARLDPSQGNLDELVVSIDSAFVNKAAVDIGSGVGRNPDQGYQHRSSVADQFY